MAAKRLRTCPECGQQFRTARHDQEFCTPVHKAAFHNRSSKIGRSLVPMAMAWRAGRNARGNSPEALALKESAARAFAEMCRLIDVAVAEDREAGRTPKLEYVRRRWRLEGTDRREESADHHRAKQEAAKARKTEEGKAK